MNFNKARPVYHFQDCESLNLFNHEPPTLPLKLFVYRALLHAYHLLQKGKIEDLIVDNLGSQFSKEEIERIVKVSLLCTSETLLLRPVMSEAIGMIEGIKDVPH